MDFANFIIQHQWIVWLAILWTLPWKMAALWKAAKNNHLVWFVVLFLFNTLAALEIAYIFFFGRKKETANISKFPFARGNGTRKIV